MTGVQTCALPICVVWTVIACVVAFTLLRVGGFLAVRTVSVITGIPLAIIMYLMILSLMKILKEDKNRN